MSLLRLFVLPYLTTSTAVAFSSSRARAPPKLFGSSVKISSPTSFLIQRHQPKAQTLTAQLSSYEVRPLTSSNSTATDSYLGSAEGALSDLTTQPVRKGAYGPAPVLVLEGDTLETRPSHIALVAGLWGLSVIALGPVVAAVTAGGPTEWVAFAAVAIVSVAFSDLFSGVFHWATDNYGSGSTPVFGGVIEAFQGHHVSPWTITHRGFANNVHKIAKAAIPLLGVLMVLTRFSPKWRLVSVIFVNAQLLSQEFHKLAHSVKPPGWASWLQKRGLIIGRREHGMHHTPPFEAHYCILTGWCNGVLDQTGAWRRLEALVYRLTGEEPNCWKEGPAVKKKALGE